jgi:hypothetical protein
VNVAAVVAPAEVAAVAVEALGGAMEANSAAADVPVFDPDDVPGVADFVMQFAGQIRE